MSLINKNAATTSLVCLILACALPSLIRAQYLEKLITPPAGFEPTSAVAVTKSTSGYVTIFYRGPAHQLVRAEVSETGDLSDVVDMGGILTTAPDAATPTAVAYARADLRVVVRSLRPTGWSGERVIALKSEHQPYVTAGDGDTICVQVTALNNRLQRRCRTGNAWQPVQRTSDWAYGSPGYFIRNFNNKISAIPTFPRVTSRICHSDFVEGGQLFFARAADGNMIIGHNFDYTDYKWVPRGKVEQWMSAAPGCLLVEFCSNAIFPQGDKLFMYQECS